MKNPEEIECEICRRSYPDFEAINDRINQAGTLAEKATFAKQLIDKAEDVLQEHNASDNLLTEACLTVLNLRKKTAKLILRLQV